MQLLLRKHLLLALIMMPFLLSAGYSYKKVKCFVIVPPEQVLSGVTRIAVLDFEGERDAGKNFSNYLISKLLQKDRGIQDIKTGFLGLGGKVEGKTMQDGTFTNIFEVVERSRLMQVVDEQKLGLSGLLNQTQATQLGELLGVQAIVMGNVTSTHEESNYQENRTYKRDGKKVTERVNCRKRKVNVTVRARVISSETGQIIGSTEASHALDDKKCDKEIANLKTIAQMTDECLDILGGSIANYIAPHYEYQDYELEKYKVDKYDKMAERAAELAEDMDIDESWVIYKSIYDKDPYSPKLLFNLGVLNEVVGNYEDALEFYQMASQLRQEDNYDKAARRVEKNVKFAESLAQIGVTIQKHEFSASAQEKAQVLAKKVEIKGSREDRVPILLEPRDASEVVTRVPGGVTFTVVKREGNWLKLKLLGGQEGYIQADKVKTVE